MNQYDFVGIGDIVTDAFIHLKEASVHCDINKEKCQICMKFGDKIPYDEVYVVPAVGNSSNASVAASRLGLKSALVSNVGDDYYGNECLEALKKENVATEFIKTQAGKKTNYHYVLWFEDDRTILIKHQEYEYKLPDIGQPKWIYFSSIGSNSLPFHEELEKYLTLHDGKIKLAFQPGTYQIKFGKDELSYFYGRAEIVFINKDEAQRILEISENDIKILLEETRKLGPKIVVITDGPKGAYSYDGEKMLFMPAYPDPKPPYERTGAGDAFSSTFTAAMALGKSVREALMWAPINSMSVVQDIGARAGLLTRAQLEDYLKKAPEDYKPVKI
ncbi:MAG: carbohydrate kinase family protein [Patescibacteria group bacterium]